MEQVGVLRGGRSLNNAKAENGLTAQVRETILVTLQVFPVLSPSHLHISIGSQKPKDFWEPILMDLIYRGIVKEQTHTYLLPSGRHTTVTLLSLAETRTVVGTETEDRS